jgi:hypothetical protein
MIPAWLMDGDDEQQQDMPEVYERPVTHTCPQCGQRCRCWEGADLVRECQHEC